MGAPGSLAIAAAMFLLLAAGVAGIIYYAYPWLSASYSATSNLTRYLENLSRSQGYNYTVQQIQSIMRQEAYVAMAVSAMSMAVGALAWLYAYRPDVRGDLRRAASSSLYLGVLSIILAFGAVGFFLVFAGSLLSAALLIGAWLRIRPHLRRSEALASVATP